MRWGDAARLALVGLIIVVLLVALFLTAAIL